MFYCCSSRLCRSIVAFDFYEGCTFGYCVAFGNEYAFYAACDIAGDAVLHLHGFEDNHILPLFTHIADFYVELEYGTGQRCCYYSACYLAVIKRILACGCICLCSIIGLCGFPTLFLLLHEEVLGNHREEFEEEHFLFVLRQFYTTELFEYGVGLHFVFRGVVVGLFPYAGNLETEFRVNGYGSVTVFTFYKAYELVGNSSVFRLTLLDVEGTVNGLCAYNLAGRSNERRQTSSKTYFGDKFHGFLEKVFTFELLELCHHVGVHTAWDFGTLYEFVGLRETEVCLNLVACVDEGSLVGNFCSGNGSVEFCVDFCWQSIVQRVERLRELVYCIVVAEFLTDGVEFLVNLCNCFEV